MRWVQCLEKENERRGEEYWVGVRTGRQESWGADIESRCRLETVVLEPKCASPESSHDSNERTPERVHTSTGRVQPGEPRGTKGREKGEEEKEEEEEEEGSDTKDQLVRQ